MVGADRIRTSLLQLAIRSHPSAVASQKREAGRFPQHLIAPLCSFALLAAIAVVWNPFVGEKFTNNILEIVRDVRRPNGGSYANVATHHAEYAAATEKSIYVFIYTTDNPEGGDIDFRRSAETRVADIQQSLDFDSNDIVLIRGLKSRGEFESFIRSVNEQFGIGKIKELAIFSHGGVDGPIFHGNDGKQEQYTDFMSNLTINFSPSASAKFMSCLSAKFAQGFADIHRVASSGFLTRTIFSGSPSSKTYRYLVTRKEYTLGSTGRRRRFLGEAVLQPVEYDPLPWWTH